MSGKLTNNSKKEQRQINQLLTKAVNEDGTRGKEIEARTIPKQHQTSKTKPRGRR